MPRSVQIEDQRTATLVVMVTPDEKIELVRAAAERLTTVSSLLRAKTLFSVRAEAKASRREMETA
jgi:hypothetical protein